MRVRLQIDIQYPLDKSKRQAMPDPQARYASSLDFRMRYDSMGILNQIRAIGHELNRPTY